MTSSRHSLVALAAGLVGLVLLSYTGAFGFPLVFDDGVVRRAIAPGGMDFSGIWPRWLSYGSFAATAVLAGPGVEALRLGNVLLHAATAIAIFYLCRQLVADDMVAAIAAGAFALHPVTVYGVAYLAQRSIVMATLFSVLCLIAWLRGRLQASWGWHAAAVVFYGLALLSKEHAVMVPAVAILLSMALREQVRGSRRQALVTLGAMALLALWAVWSMRAVVGQAPEPVPVGVLSAVAATHAEAGQLYLVSALNQAALFFRYVLTWLLPLPGFMSVDVRLDLAALPAAAVGALCFIAWGLIGLWHLAAPDGRRLLALAMLTPWLLFFTEFASVRVQEQFVLYRSYLWGIGFSIFMAGALISLSRKGLTIAATVTVLLSGAGMSERLATFSSPVALWDDAVIKLSSDRAPLADRPIGNRGVSLMRAGRLEEAMRDFDRAVQVSPHSPPAYFNRAMLKAYIGQIPQAQADLAQAQRLQRNAL